MDEPRDSLSGATALDAGGDRLPGDGFLWGVATSPYQAEGGYNGPSQPQNNWSEAESTGHVMPSGAASGFWERYREDFARCRAMGLNAFRLGVCWSRIQPTRVARAGAEPLFDRGALGRYAEMLATCRQAGLEPVLTLHHFVHPAWLGADPWLDPETPGLFARYVRETVRWINRVLVGERGLEPVRYYITINEPNMLVLNSYFAHQFPAGGPRGFGSVTRAYNQILRAHVLAYNALHDLHLEEGWARPWVTLNNYCSDLYWSDKLLLDLLATRERGVEAQDAHDYICAKAGEFAAAFERARLPLHRDLPFLFGALFKRLCDRWGRKRFEGAYFAPFFEELRRAPRARAFDYLGLDYYDPFTAHAFRLPRLWDHEFRNRSVRSWVLNTVTSKWWDWRVLPRGLHFFCRYFSEDFGGRPVLIAENGMALRRKPDNRASPRRDRMTRSRFLRLHVHEVERLVEEGVPVFGYLHWSLFDNYEWGSFTPRFGLFAIDYARGTERLVEDHHGDRPSETYAALVARFRERFPRCFGADLGA